jgi:hypothetical protein
MGGPSKSGVRVGDWFLWIDAEIVTANSYRKVPLVTLRKAISGGDILQTSVATREMAKALRTAADNIEAMVNSAEGVSVSEDEA